jgi:leucyl aminopeptidase
MGKPVELKISTRIGDPGANKKVQGIFAGVFKEDGESKLVRYLDRFCPVKITDLIKRKEIIGNFKEFHVIHLDAEQPIERVVLIGLGEKKDFTRDTVRSTAAKAARTLRKVRCPSMAVVASSFGNLKADLAAEAVVEGCILGLYKFQKFLKKSPTVNQLDELIIFCRNKAEETLVKEGIRRGVALSEATNAARVLASTPPNMLRPVDLVSFAKGLAKRHKKVSLKVFGDAALEKMGAGGILGVGRGSENESFLIDLHYKGGAKDALNIALVGKGVTFDTGGISIKPSSGMHQMKYDMGGSAAVLGAMDAIANLGLPVNVHGIVPTAENMPDGSAYKPGDVLTMLSGHHVEVLNTDAEGRLLLADGITYAVGKKPDLIVDVATLTGAVIIALGHTASGLFSNRAALPKWIMDAGKDYNEKFWHLPTFDEYKIQLASIVSDFTNDGGRPAGSSTAAMFLKNFTEDIPWAHLDIAGTAWIEESSTLYVHKPYLPQRGATGVGVRTLASLVSNLAAKGSNKEERAKLRKQLEKKL